MNKSARCIYNCIYTMTTKTWWQSRDNVNTVEKKKTSAELSNSSAERYNHSNSFDGVTVNSNHYFIMSFSVASKWSQVVKKKNESAVSMRNFHNDCFPIFFCFSFLSVNFVLNNSIAQYQELCLSKNTWGGSWHIHLSQLRIPFMKHLKTNWKKKSNIDFILQSSKVSYKSIMEQLFE